MQLRTNTQKLYHHLQRMIQTPPHEAISNYTLLISKVCMLSSVMPTEYNLNLHSFGWSGMLHEGVFVDVR